MTIVRETASVLSASRSDDAESADGHQHQVHRAELRGGPLGEGIETVYLGYVERPGEHALHAAGTQLGGGRLKAGLVAACKHNG